MDNWIRCITEPKKLFLAWQAPDHLRNRYRWAVGIIERETSRQEFSLRYFQPDEFGGFNQGRSFDEVLSLGYRGFPTFNFKKRLHTDRVLDAFVRRLPPRSRPDFSEYKAQFRVPGDLELTELMLLGLTEAKLPSDGFSLVDPLDPTDRCRDLMLEVAGYRYYAPELEERPLVGERIDIEPEPWNSHDRNAVMLSFRGQKVGNINRLQAESFLSWLSARTVTATVQRLNGKPESPRAFVFIRVRSEKSAEAA